MTASIAEQFIEALRGLEENREVEAMVALYAEQSEVGNVNAPEKFTGQAGAREFWTKYRDTFGEVRSTFRNRIITGGHAALEWTTEGTTANGAPFNYEGVSILEIEGDRITRFRAYFDPEALGQQIERAATSGN
ncbi:MAG TPA: nuclear transport factor 2 family protein [Pyrinomonadaceae bacterium]|nr:nuclear transport factor 2 family protein [Pyrinomonadaceae bacterium]